MILVINNEIVLYTINITSESGLENYAAKHYLLKSASCISYIFGKVKVRNMRFKGLLTICLNLLLYQLQEGGGLGL